MCPVVDFHTHAFPDALAPHAVARLEEKGRIRSFLDGTVAALLASMDRAGIAAAVVCSVATEPRQFEAILRWSTQVRGPRIHPFPSVHPRTRAAADEVRQVAAAGFRGIKLHPEYQAFHVDDPGLADLYAAAERAGLVVLLHAGHDLGFPDSDRASPVRVRRVLDAYPSLRLVAAHLGGYRRWEEVAEHLAGSRAYLDTSFAIGHIPPRLWESILSAHGADRVLFGSDSPWADQAAALEDLRGQGLPPSEEARILGGNACALLGID